MPLAEGSLKSLRAIVTGGGSGLGREVGLRFVELGATVAIIGRRDESLKETTALAGERGDRMKAIPCDVRSFGSVQEAVALVGQAFGGIDVVVNSAGGQFIAPFEAISPRGWNSVVDLNLTGVYNVLKCAYPWLSESGRASVVNISLSGVERGSRGLAHSIAARSGVLGLTRTLALEWSAKRIRVNCIGPGFMRTEGFDNEVALQDTESLIEESVPWGRATRVSEVAEAIAFLVSPSGEMISGQVLFVDGLAHLGPGIHFV